MSYAAMAAGKVTTLESLETAMVEMRMGFEKRLDSQQDEIAALKLQLSEANEEIVRLRKDAASVGKSVEDFGNMVKKKVFPSEEPALKAADVVEEVKRTVSKVVDEQVWESVERKARVCSIRVTGLEESADEDPSSIKDKIVALFRDA